MEWYVYFSVSGFIVLFIVIPSIFICKCKSRDKKEYRFIESNIESAFVKV
jgi:hypothetical protein